MRSLKDSFRFLMRATLVGAAMASCSAPESPNAPEPDVETAKSSIHDPNAALCQDPVDMVNPVLVTGNGVETVPGCCAGTRLDQLHNSADVYSDSASESFVRTLRPKMQLFAPHGSPFSQSEVYIATGWVRSARQPCPAPYGSSLCTNGHGGIDYVKTAAGDPSFNVRAVAAGQVISIERNEDEGNTVVIEHTASDGTRYRSIYVHLRNGARHDCNAAKKDAANDSDGYRKYMDKQICPDPARGIAGNLDPMYWGTEAQTLHVKLGDMVQARQVIADSGNTGRGAIGRMIDGNGNVSGTNVHLHLYFAVFHPGVGQANSNAKWIVVDPYGVYGYVSASNCYDPSANTPGYRLFAPFNLFTHRNDFNGDNKTDYVLYRPSTGTWFAHPAAGGWDLQMQFGVSTDTPVPGDYDGDGRTDWAVFRPSTGTWYVRPRAGTPDMVMQFGVSTDKPVPGDYDGDGKIDWAVYRPSEGNWYVRPSGGGSDIVMLFGQSSDLPVPGDYDGDGKTDFAVYRPSNGTWYVRPRAGGSDIVMQFGQTSDNPVSGDFDGDGKTDFAVFRPSNGTWYARPRAGGSDIVQQWGVSTDRPVSGDYDGDGKTDFAVFRPSTGTWFVRTSASGDLQLQFGASSDLTPFP